jgi:hypothetical protein
MKAMVRKKIVCGEILRCSGNCGKQVGSVLGLGDNALILSAVQLSSTYTSSCDDDDATPEGCLAMGTPQVKGTFDFSVLPIPMVECVHLPPDFRSHLALTLHKVTCKCVNAIPLCVVTISERIIGMFLCCMK